MDRQTPRAISDEIDLYIRTYYSLLRSSGDVLLDGLGDVDWTSGKAGLAAKTDAFRATLSKKGKLVVKTTGQCTIKATLKRRTSKIASCDRVDRLARINRRVRLHI